VVRLALQQLLDAGELSVCQTEGTMDRLFNGGSQSTSLARGPDGPSGSSLTEMSGHDSGGLRGVADAYLPGLLLLACLWGASYPFMREGVKEVEPAALIDGRLLLATPLLLAYAARRSGGWRPLAEGFRRFAVPCLLLGLFNVAVPYAAICWAEKHVDSGTAAIANSVVPIFVVLLALRFVREERVGPWRLLGLTIGLGGVGLLVGVSPGGGWLGIAGALTVVGASLLYAACSMYARRRVREAPGPVLAAGSVAVGAVLLVPLAAFDLPSRLPGASTWVSLAGLALLGTVGAQIVYFHLLQRHGAGRVTMVAYLIPIVSVIIAAAWLGEAFTAAKAGGLVLILGGVALGSGVWQPGRRRMIAS